MRRIVFAGVLLFFPAFCHAAITIDDNVAACTFASVTTASCASVTISSGTSKLLIASVSHASPTDRTTNSCSWNGSPLTKLGESSASHGNDRLAIFYKTNPSAASATFSCTFSGSGVSGVIKIYGMSGVDQTTGVSNFVSKSSPAAGTSDSIAIASASGNLVLTAAAFGSSITGVTINGGAASWAANSSDGEYAAGAPSVPGSSSVSVAYRWTGSSDYSLGGANIIAFGAPPPPPQATSTGQWSTLPYLMPINPVHVALLHNGKVLVVSGSGNVANNTNFKAAIWDRTAGTVTTMPVAWDMFCNSMTVMADGRVFINGGTLQYDPFFGQQRTSIYDPATNTFTDLPNMAHGRWYPTAIELGDGSIMTHSGLDVNGSTTPTVEIYNVGTGWSPSYSASWTPPLYPRLHLLPNGNVFYSGETAQSRMFNTGNKTWTSVATTNSGADRLFGSSVLLPLLPENNYAPRVMIMGGGDPSISSTELIDLSAASPAWSLGPSMTDPRIEMNAVILPNGKVLALGGSYNDEDMATASYNADLYDPSINGFTPAGQIAYARLYHSVALLLPDATVWIAGGNPVRGTYEPHMEIYKPAYLFTTDAQGNLVDATRPSIAVAPSGVSYGNSFTVQTPDAPNISSVVLLRPGSSTHAFDMDQRLVGLNFTLADTSNLNVTAPPNGNIAPPGYYMLFLVNTAGVPSVASFVQIVTTSDFAITATPSSATVNQGSSTTYTVSVTPQGGFTGTVNLSLSGLPAGATATFNPAAIASGSSTLTVSTAASTPTGTYSLTITGVSGTLTHTANVSLVVIAPGDFSLSVSPLSLAVTRGTTDDYTVSVTGINGFIGSVALSVSGLPANTTGTFTATSIGSGKSTTLKIRAKRAAVPGTYPLTVTGTSGSLTHSVGVSLTIR